MSIIRAIFEHTIGRLYYLPILRHSYVSRKRIFRPLYRRLLDEKPCSVEPKEKTVIYMSKPETTFCGGLSDRLRGITAIYQECKREGIAFKVNMENPVLADYLRPNEYDWTLKKGEIDYDMKRVYPCTILTYHPYDDDKEKDVQHKILRYFIKKPYDQIHVYSNMKISDEAYGRCFHELFRPSDELQNALDYHLNRIGGKQSYISCTFRFRQLLGDFKEGGETLSAQQREPYIQRCIKTVEHLHEMHPCTILVTSDSVTFLDRIKALHYVYIIPGKVVHMGFTFDASKQTHMKSFVDYFMLSYARTVYLVRDRLMYHSGFPLRAALLNGAEYKEIELK